jgi:hypothetical protein
MKLTQRIPLQFFNEMAYELAQASVILTWNLWANSGNVEYPYDAAKQVSYTKSTESAFRNWAFASVICSLVATLSKYLFDANVELILVIGFLGLAAILGLLSL